MCISCVTPDSQYYRMPYWHHSSCFPELSRVTGLVSGDLITTHLSAVQCLPHQCHHTHLLHAENTNESCSENTEPTDLSTLFSAEMMMIVDMWMWQVQESMYSYNVVFKYFENDRWKDVFFFMTWQVSAVKHSLTPTFLKFYFFRHLTSVCM